jgi:hypothetical protein
MDMLVKNLAAFTESLGMVNAPMIVHLSLVPWPDDATRNDFIKNLTNHDMSRNL